MENGSSFDYLQEHLAVQENSQLSKQIKSQVAEVKLSRVLKP